MIINQAIMIQIRVFVLIMQLRIYPEKLNQAPRWMSEESCLQARQEHYFSPD